MRILVTNDDGINAPGLEACATIARELSADVWVIAPESDQSGVSHSLSLNDPLRLRKIDDKRYAVKGTPTDCIIMGVRHVMTEKPDLILSGVNRGFNVGEDVTYSGTIAAAIEGTILGFPAFALSQGYGAGTKEFPFWETAIQHGPSLIRKVLAEGMPKDVLVNINFPNCLPDEVKGVAVSAQGKRDQDWIRIEPREDGRRNPYFWIAFDRGPRPEPSRGTDLAAIAAGYISVTPLSIDLTDEPFMTKLAEVLA